MNHKSSFNNINKRHTTELESYIWDLKDNNTYFKIAKSKFNTQFGCILCNLEKIQTDTTDKTKLLKKKKRKANYLYTLPKVLF